MEPTRQRMTESSQPKAGVSRDLERLKADGNASAAEIREFFARLQGKSPQEMLGVVAQSRLAMSILWSAIGTFVLLFGISLWAYAFSGDTSGKQGAANKQQDAVPVTTKSNNAAAGPNKSLKQKPDIAKKLGHKEVKTGTPANFEKLLDGDK